MRIGRFNQIVNAAVDANGELQTNGVAKHAGQVYVIEQFSTKAKLVLTLQGMGLLPVDTPESTIDIFIDNEDETHVEVETTQHSEIVSLFKQINAKLPVFSELAEHFSPDQEETVVNIKLPDEISSLAELQAFNKRLDTLFKKFNVTGNFKIVGFDAGTEWYQVLLDNAGLFSLFISCVSLALQAIDFRDSRKGSDDLRLAKKAIDTRDPQNDLTEQKLLNSMVDGKIEEDVETTIDELGCPDGRGKPETSTMVIGAVKELVKEIDKGTEFHLSLNPPEYAKENGSNDMPAITIDYSSIPRISTPEAEVAQIEAGEVAAETSEDMPE
ncbi:MAG: hypothetical protein ACTJG2_03270 [Candidatus Saccharimonadales bacterium]